MNWLAVPMYSRLQLGFYTMNLIWFGFTRDVYIFLFNTLVIFSTYMTVRSSVKAFVDRLVEYLGDYSEARQKELEFNIMKLCEAWHINFLKSKQKIELKSTKKGDKN